MTLDLEDIECFDTFEKCKLRLDAIEYKLAAKHLICVSEGLHWAIVQMHKSNQLHDEDWLEEYSNYLDWLEHP